MAEDGATMRDLTVLAAKNDPFRVDTPAGRRDGRWFAEHVNDPDRHLRGWHYLTFGVMKPNGKPLIDSRWTFVEQTRRLLTDKAYGDAA